VLLIQQRINNCVRLDQQSGVSGGIAA